MLKLSKFCLKIFNLQNTAINIIIVKRLLHLKSDSHALEPENLIQPESLPLRSSHTEASIR